ncbi:hypothetical protein NKH77_30840 [Streptomyces sp. M19]
MSDLRLEGTVFEHLRTTFSTVSDRMDTARRAARHGRERGRRGGLIEDVHDFADEWGYGIKQLGKHTDDARKMIEKIGKEFGKFDTDLAESLKASKKTGK